jgi:hypothetical protein
MIDVVVTKEFYQHATYLPTLDLSEVALMVFQPIIRVTNNPPPLTPPNVGKWVLVTNKVCA